MKKVITFLFLTTSFFIFPTKTIEASLDHLSGMILLQVEENGEAWYIYPPTQRRHFLGRPSDAFSVMRELGLGITHSTLTEYLDSVFPDYLSGKIMLDVEKNGEAYYVYPKDMKGYYLGKPSGAFKIMRKLGLGISNNDLNNILKKIESANEKFSTYENKTIKTTNGNFDIQLITIDRNYPNLKIYTSTGNSNNCENNCNAKPLMNYHDEFSGFASIHGAYFCPPDYNDCNSKINFFYSPFYNSKTKFWANKERLKWTEGPIIIIDKNNNPYFFLRTNEVYTPEQFELQHGASVQAALSNGPALIQNSKNIVSTEPMDDKQKNIKSYRGGFGYDNNNYYLVISKNSTVPDLATIFQEIGATHAINLDGGGSSAMIFDGEYKIGPGRKLPTAIIFGNK